MNQILKDKKIVVAGAGGLLGSSVIKSILDAGGSVVATDVSLENVKERLLKVDVSLNNPMLSMVELDITKSDNVARFWQTIGGVTGAVNCAYPRNKNYGAKFFDVTFDSFNENVSLHLGSAFLFAQQSAEYYLANKKPFSLVNISSIYGVIAPKFSVYKDTAMTMPVEYAAIKSAIIHLSKYIVKYVSESEYRVNCVSLGGLFDNQPPSFLNEYKQHTNGGGMLSVDDVVGSIIFLLSDSSKFITGQNIIVDDGFSI